MPGRSRIAIAKPQVEAHLDECPHWVWGRRELGGLLEAYRTTWKLAWSMNTTDFIDYLCSKSLLREAVFTPTEEKYAARPIRRYLWRAPSFLEIGGGLLGGSSYLSHGTAVFVHGLNDEVPTTVYMNREQSPKPRATGELSQAAVNRAFGRKSKQRKSRLVYRSSLDDDPHYYIALAGKHTNRAGVVELRTAEGRLVQVTNLERTLIDIAVRPSYAGGVDRVLEAYEAAAREGASIGRLLSLLNVLDYRYPYHQCIGFYAERAGFRENQLERLERLSMPVDFYLTYGMKRTAYVERWKLFVPEDLAGDER